MICQLIHGDAGEVLFDDTQIKQSSIDLTVTSPPYGTVRDYKGHAFTWEKFKTIAYGLYRVTKDGGVVVWVVGDTVEKRSKTLAPFEQALYFKEIGFVVHDVMIYEKNTTAITCQNRYKQCFEYMFVFVRGNLKTFNIIKDRENVSVNTKVSPMPRGKNGIRKPLKMKEKLKRTKKFGQRLNIWRYIVGRATSKDKIAYEHPAIFPEALARDHIRSWSNQGDTVLDPFCGSGTTGKMAKQWKRNFIGIEIAEEYCHIAKKRILG